MYARRLENWCQTQETRITNPEEGAALIQRVGVATLFPASPEIPNLFHAYTGDPNSKTESRWDSPSGRVYTWRWPLGQQEQAFYSTLIKGRPTWISWELLPPALCLWGELRPPDELYEAGELSPDAYRITRALAAPGDVLTTGELREEAGFPTGKPQRAAYLRAVKELETRLLLAKVFSTEDNDMRHALVQVHYPEQVNAARRMTREKALEQFLSTYLPQAVYTMFALLSRQIKLPKEEVHAGLERLVRAKSATCVTIPEHKDKYYIWSVGN